MAAEKKSSESGVVLGINLGNSNSCVAVWQDGRVEVIPDQHGRRITPSYVAFTDEGLLFGSDARQQISINPEGTISGMKLLLGRRYDDEVIQNNLKEWSFRVHEGENCQPVIEVKSIDVKKFFPPEQILGLFLSELKTVAEKHLTKGSSVEEVVMTVPAYFNTSQRKAIEDAANIAGLKVLVVINEPTAAVLAYGLEEIYNSDAMKKNVLIYHMGGSTLDVSLVEIWHRTMEVKATITDHTLGGKNFSANMVKHFVEVFNKNHNVDINDERKSILKLRDACDVTKTLLSVEKTVSVAVEVEALYKGNDLLEKITRKKFEELNKDLFEKCMEPVSKCLEAAKMSKEQVDEIILVGGSTRIPKVRLLLQDFFKGKKLNYSLHPDEAVACGAAIQGAKLAGQGNKFIQEFDLKDVTPFSLGLEGEDGKMQVVVPKNTTLPTEKQITRTTIYDNQVVMDLKVYEGEGDLVKDNHFLGRLQLDNVTSAPKGVAEVVVTFTINDKGMLQVKAEDKKSGSSTAKPISEDAGRLSQEQIKQIASNTEKIKLKDEKRKTTLKIKNELEEYATSVITNIGSGNLPSELVGDTDKARNAAEEALKWSEKQDLETDKKEFETRMQNLQKICNPFVMKI